MTAARSRASAQLQDLEGGGDPRRAGASRAAWTAAGRGGPVARRLPVSQLPDRSLEKNNYSGAFIQSVCWGVFYRKQDRLGTKLLRFRPKQA